MPAFHCRHLPTVPIFDCSAKVEPRQPGSSAARPGAPFQRQDTLRDGGSLAGSGAGGTRDLDGKVRALLVVVSGYLRKQLMPLLPRQVFRLYLTALHKGLSAI